MFRYVHLLPDFRCKVLHLGTFEEIIVFLAYFLQGCRQFPYGHLHSLCLPFTQQLDRDLGTGCSPRNQVPEHSRVRYRRPVVFCNNIASFYPCSLRGAIFRNITDKYSFFFLQVKLFCTIGGHRLNRHPKPPSDNLPTPDKTVQHRLRHIARYCETYPLVSARSTEYGCIDPDEFAMNIYERPSGIAGIYCRVGLDEILVISNADIRPADCTNDPRRNGLVQ